MYYLRPEEVTDLKKYLSTHPPDTAFALLTGKRYWLLVLKYTDRIWIYYHFAGSFKQSFTEVRLQMLPQDGCTPVLSFYDQGMITGSFVSPAELRYLMEHGAVFRRGVITIQLLTTQVDRLTGIQVGNRKRLYTLPPFALPQV